MMQKQRGMTIWSWLFVLGSIGFLALVTMKLLPIYMENMSVKKAVKQVAELTGAAGFNKETAWKALSKQFYIDEVKSIKKEDMSIEVNDEGTKEMVIFYEIRTSMIGNVDVVVWFEERVPLNG